MTTQTNPSTQPQPQRRPTLVIGLGGTGHRIALELKSLVYRSWTPAQIEQNIRFLVFDTTQEDLAVSHPDREISLEPGSELHDIGQTPVANIKRHLSRQSAIEERLGGVIGNLPPAVLRSGAKQLRPLGLLAFLWRYADIETQLREAVWSLAGRQNREGREGINVFIANSLVGGTGSSTFLDVAHVVRDLFDELGTLADFCYITGVGMLPRAFHGINGPNLIPNAVASLKELNHCMMRGGFTARYPNGRTIRTLQPPFNMFYLIDGVDESGHTWNGPTEVCRLAAEAIFLQIGSQVGQKHENDFDNLDEVLVQQAEDGLGTFYGSFGLASLHFPSQSVVEICTARQAKRLIEEALLVQPSEDATTTPAIQEYVAANGLTPAALSEHLARDDQGVPLEVELTVPGWANRLAPTSLPTQLVRYVRDYERARLNTDFRRWLTHNEKTRLIQQTHHFNRHLSQWVRQHGLPSAQRFLTHLAAHLDTLLDQLHREQAERDSQQTAVGQELGHLETVFLQAGESSFLGRSRRVTRAQHAYLTTAQTCFTLRWQLLVLTSSLTLLSHFKRLIQESLSQVQAVITRLEAVKRTLATKETSLPETGRLAGVTTQSLLTPAMLNHLFSHYAPPLTALLADLFSHDRSPLAWRDLSPAEIEATLLTVCHPAFTPITTMSIEQLLAQPEIEASPESSYTHLVKQATPSWNLDRTRLPEGGAALQRVEVLGIPDETVSNYRGRTTALVSTGDPERITAFAAHIGAAHTAIQQWDSYEQTYEQARGHVPLHILPQFQADNDRARQTFALGSLFNFITNQGAYFYYIPADPLARPLKLAQGLANSLQAFTNQAGLVQEVRERIDQIVASQGIETTLRRLRHYYESDNGRFPSDELILELKRLVRTYADELGQIYQFAPSPHPNPQEREQVTPLSRAETLSAGEGLGVRDNSSNDTLKNETNKSEVWQK